MRNLLIDKQLQREVLRPQRLVVSRGRQRIGEDAAVGRASAAFAVAAVVEEEDAQARVEA